MKLTDLDPSWFVAETGGPIIGLSFLCPHCIASQQKPQRLGIVFHPSGTDAMEAERDKYIVAKTSGFKNIWEMTGSDVSNPTFTSIDFINVTLTPSVDASGLGHWHGFITNGFVA